MGRTGIRLSNLYSVWDNMKQRCTNHRKPKWRNYGGRGITVCQEWQNDYEAFRFWALVNGYKPGLTLDRIDNDGPYSPDNCRFVTNKVNCNNTNRTVMVVAFGECKTIAQWTEDPRCNTPRTTLQRRIADGWDAERALTSPPRSNHNSRRTQS